MSLVFFTDRDLGKEILPSLLRENGLVVERYDDHFDPTTPDDEWLPEVGRRGWLVLTRDKRIRYKRNEQDAVMQAGVGLFVLVGCTSHRELAENFIATIHRVETFIERHHPPFIAKIYCPSSSSTHKKHRPPGQIRLWLSYDQWSSRRPC